MTVESLGPFKVAAAAVDREGEHVAGGEHVGGVGGEGLGCEGAGGERVSLGVFCSCLLFT